MIRVLVADDHAVVRAGIVALLGSEPDIEVVGEAVDGVEAVELAAALTPDLVVMDVRMPRLTGDEATARILAGVRSVAAGEVALSPAIAAQLVARMRQPAHPALTPRETEVLRLVAAGLTNKQIGERLHLGEATVKTHLLRTFDKLGVSDRTRAVTLAMERGLL